MLKDNELKLDTTEIKERLNNLEEYMPDEHEMTYDFAAYLADKLNPTIVPMGFKMSAELALYYLAKGVDELSGEPIKNRLVGYSPIIYGAISMSIPQIADAVCPEEFAKEVTRLCEEIEARY